MSARDRHNEAAGRLVKEMVRSVGSEPQHLNVLAESLLLGVAMINFPADPRRQALIIQAIADVAADRVKVSSAYR